MVYSNSGIFLELPSKSGQPVLHPAKVLGLADDRYTAEPVATDLAFEPSQRLNVYYFSRREFMKQLIEVDSTDDSEAPPVIKFLHLGDPCSAERRAEFRVSAVMADIFVGLGDEPACELLDISMKGCSVLADESYKIGKPLRISLNHDGRTVLGTVVVRGIRPGSKGKTRYGLGVGVDPRSDGNLKKVLRQMTMDMERTQLRRLSRC